MKNLILLSIVALVSFGCVSGNVSDNKAAASAELPLPAGCKTPDGMVLGADGDIYLSINQSSDGFKNKAKIVKITRDDRFEDVITLSVLKESGVASPMGLAFDSAGNLYVADNQMFGGHAGKSRILRVKFENGKAVSCGAVVENLSVANGLAYANGKLYLTDCMVDFPSNPVKSIVYVFDVSKLDESNPIKISGRSDPHVFDRLTTHFKHDWQQVGADGIAADGDGNIYVANFGEASVSKYELSPSGKILKKSVLFKGGPLKSCDGLRFDRDGNLWIADFAGNAVGMYDFKTGKVSVVKKSPIPSDGSAGTLNAPADIALRGGRLYISNMNVNMSPHKASPVHSMTVVDLR